MTLSKDQNEYTDIHGTVHSAHPVDKWRCYTDDGKTCSFFNEKTSVCEEAYCLANKRNDRRTIIWLKKEEV